MKVEQLVSRLSERRAGRLIAGLSLIIVLAVAALLLIPRQTQLDVTFLPRLNAILNGASAVCLAMGYFFIRRRRIKQHRLCMLTAFGLSAAFLVSYVVYHALAGSRAFTGEGWIRPIYFTLLISHVVLAAVVLPLALTTLYRAWRSDFGRHRRLARWTLPLWFWVSVSGVLVYILLYHWR